MVLEAKEFTITEAATRTFWKNVIKYPGGGCWIWTGGTNSKRNPYGRFWIGKDQQVMAHRYSWALEHGSCDPTLSIDHLCMNTLCMNPLHMELVTFEENSRRQHERREPERQQQFLEDLNEALGAWRNSPEGKARLKEMNKELGKTSWVATLTHDERVSILQKAWRSGKFDNRRKQRPYTRIDWSQPCQRGHERTPENTYFLDGRPRYCKACKYERRKSNEQNGTGPGHCTED
jgi:hypothetical protein